MRTASLKRADGGSDDISAYTIEEFPFFQVPEYGRFSKHKRIFYLNAFMTFDIETTTIGKVPEDNPYGFMYHWQATVAGVPVYGRRWEDWLDLMRELSEWLELSEERRMVVYVHNLGYEFQFIKHFLRDELGGYEVFASRRREPLYVMAGAGFEFRCSMKLTNMTLYKATTNELGVIHIKAKGDLDYSKLRTADTPLDDTEFSYCIGDVVSLHELILNRLANESDFLDTVPLTSTGYVRRDCRKACRADRHYRDRVFKKQAMSADVYTLLKEAGRGGNTHANRFMSARIWPEVESFDVASCYPYVMICRSFPMGKFAYYGELESLAEFEDLLKTKACLFHIILEGVRIKKGVSMPYIPIDKVLYHGGRRLSNERQRGKIEGALFDNGRILEIDWLCMTVTEIDWQIIDSQYDYTRLSVSDMYVASKGSLPEPIRLTVMKYFEEKTRLKAEIEAETDAEKKAELEYLYAKSKNRLNSIFGMCYTDPVRASVVVDPKTGEWDEKPADIADALEKYRKARNSFLVYAWGVWVTAHARAHLQAMIDAFGADNAIYCDTDSTKGFFPESVKEKIEAMNDHIREECEKSGAYADAGGKRYYLGVYEHETADNPYSQFVTLGAKKYAYEDADGLHITVSGVEKAEGAKELGSIDRFKPGLVFRKAGGRTLYYNERDPGYIEIDGSRMLTSSNIGMIDSTYRLGITDEYAELLDINIYEDI